MLDRITFLFRPLSHKKNPCEMGFRCRRHTYKKNQLRSSLLWVFCIEMGLFSHSGSFVKYFHSFQQAASPFSLQRGVLFVFCSVEAYTHFMSYGDKDFCLMICLFAKNACLSEQIRSITKKMDSAK